MSFTSWMELRKSAQGDGPSLSNSIVATSILPAQAKYTIPANELAIGSVIRIRAVGRLGNIVTTPGTITLDVRFGSIVVFNGAAMQMSITAHTTLPIWIDIELTVRAVGNGTTANLMGQGRATSQGLSLTAVADSTTTPATLLMPNTTPAVGSGFDSTASQTVDLFATFSVANAGNLIQIHQYAFEIDN